MPSDEYRPPSPTSLSPSKKASLTMDEAIAEMTRHNDKVRADELLVIPSSQIQSVY